MRLPRVLVVEDEALLRELVSEALRGYGFDVGTASDGREALDIMDSGGPWDVLLVDDQMPRLTGRQFLTKLRESGVLTAAIVYSGTAMLDDEERSRLHVSRVIQKPTHLYELVSAIRATLEENDLTRH